MANNYRCGCGSRGSNNTIGCLNSVAARRRWDNYPYYDGCCPDADGDYGCCYARGDRSVYAMFSACQPLAVAANGIVPLTLAQACPRAFAVNAGAISVRDPGVYLATMTVRVPAETQVDSTFSLALNDVNQPTTITPVETATGDAQPFTATSQAIFTADAGDTVAIRSAETVNLTDPSIEPMFALTLVRLDG